MLRSETFPIWFRPGRFLKGGLPKGNAPREIVARRVLVVDDCRDGANSLATLVRIWGHEARVAYDGPDALRQAVAFRPDVFLLDIGMPELDGYHLARDFRQSDEFRDALVVAVSGFGDPVHLTLGEQAGFDCYMIKPVDAIALLALLRCLKARSAPRRKDGP